MALGFLATKARPDVLTLSVPTDQAAGVAGALEQLREVASGARRAELERLAGELAGTGTLTGPRELLGELLAVAIDEAGEQLSQRCSALLRGDAAPAEVRKRMLALSGVLDLVERLAEEAEPSGGAAVHVDRLPGDEGRGA